MSVGLPQMQEPPVPPEPLLTPNAITVLEGRYLIRDENGQVIETPGALFRRVANAVASVEAQWGASPEDIRQTEGQFYRMMVAKAFLPNSPTLMNAGRRLGLLSACLVLPLEDSIADIMETARHIALVQRAGGGTGVDLSALRPKGSIVRSSGGTTDGPVSFLRMLSAVTEAIQQGAFRRGANMGVMRIDHPDILAFIDLKSNLQQVTNYNLSVAVTDDFMERLRTAPDGPHVVVNPHTRFQGVLCRKTGMPIYRGGPLDLDADVYSVCDIWKRIIERAWQCGDPGLLFIDEVNRSNPTPHLGTIRATNPCGEQPLLPYEACTLGSLNLAAFHCSSPSGLPADGIDWHHLRDTIELAVRFLDDVIDANNYPTKEIHEATHATRKIGLGVMGLADLLFKLALPYDSDEALQLAECIGYFIREASWAASSQLARARGPFPAWKGSLWDTKRSGQVIRNAQVTTIAPTGTVSIIAGCSSGIEPLFSLAFTRQVLDGKKLVEVNPIFDQALRENITHSATADVVITHAAAHGSIQDLDNVPDSLTRVFRTARDIRPEWHVRMQAAWQKHTDAAVSKTVNLAADATREDVDQSFRLAHQTRCKGITVYRDGARPLQPMVLAGSPESKDTVQPRLPEARPIPLPEIMPSLRLRQTTPFGNMHLHISVDPTSSTEREVFAQLGKGGDLANSDLEAICRLVSLLLRSGGDLRMVIDQLEGIGSSLSVPSKDGRIKSLGDGLSRVLIKYLAAKERDGLATLLSGRVTSLDPAPTLHASPGQDKQEALFKVKCPRCDAAGVLAFEEGCLKCHACGYSLC